MPSPASLHRSVPPARGPVAPSPLTKPFLTPLQVLSRWPADRPLACLWADPDPAGRPWARWTVIAEPTECRTLGTELSRSQLIEALRGLGAPQECPAGGPPFVEGWIGYLGYGLGAAFEPAAGRAAGVGLGRCWAPGAWLRCGRTLIHDEWTGQWWAGGDNPSGSKALAESLLAGDDRDDGFAIGSMTSRTGRTAFEASVARAVEYIRAGDVFQVNLAHRLSGPFSGSARALFRALMEQARPRHGAYLEFLAGAGDAHAIISASPELFLAFDAASRLVTTRPMKGTRPAQLATGRADLAASEKDRAELAMIVDLMRNDLGRVCAFGSIDVREARLIERHGPATGGVYQGVATVQGRLRSGLDIADLLAATFPGGSVTGAPKIRAMQIIEELEPVARGPYCGAIGMISDTGDALLSIAIRTALVYGGQLDYSVGAGIVAESDPGAEWAETMDKAGVILSLIGGTRTEME
jgi:para-aminobenzoate synthetase component I